MRKFNFNRFIVLFAAFFITVLQTFGSDYQSLSSKDGKVIEAKVTAYNPGRSVDIETRAGDVYKGVNLDRFDGQTIAYFNQWAAERRAEKDNARLTKDAKLTIFVKSTRDNDLNEKGDPDNREVVYDPALTFDNKDKDLSYQSVSGTLVFIGESVLSKREYHILYKEDFRVDLPANSRTRWEGTSFTNVYDDYAKNGSAFGAEYEGYLLVLRDRDGKVVLIKTSKTKWKDHYMNILRAGMRDAYSPDFSNSFEKTRV